MSDRETREAEARVDAAADRYEREHVGPESYRSLPASTTQVTINRLQQETRKLRASCARVRALHERSTTGSMMICAHCATEWPCQTIRAINGPDAGADT